MLFLVKSQPISLQILAIVECIKKFCMFNSNNRFRSCFEHHSMCCQVVSQNIHNIREKWRMLNSLKIEDVKLALSGLHCCEGINFVKWFAVLTFKSSFIYPLTGYRGLDVAVRMLLESLQHDFEELFLLLFSTLESNWMNFVYYCVP